MKRERCCNVGMKILRKLRRTVKPCNKIDQNAASAYKRIAALVHDSVERELTDAGYCARSRCEAGVKRQ